MVCVLRAHEKSCGQFWRIKEAKKKDFDAGKPYGISGLIREDEVLFGLLMKGDCLS